MFECVLNMYQFQVKGYHKKYGHERRIWYDDKSDFFSWSTEVERKIIIL